jgi:hypothetical protein
MPPPSLGVLPGRGDEVLVLGFYARIAAETRKVTPGDWLHIYSPGASTGSGLRLRPNPASQRQMT